MRDERKVCAGCGERYYPKQGWAHEGCASNAAASNAVGASNARTDEEMGVARERVRQEVAQAVAVVGRKQRWDRAKYNANAAEYMREYRRRGRLPK